MSSIQIPRPFARAVKGLRDWTELNKWAGGAEQSILDIISSIEQIAKAFGPFGNVSQPAVYLPKVYTKTATGVVTLGRSAEILSPNSVVVVLGQVDWSGGSGAGSLVEMLITEFTDGILATGRQYGSASATEGTITAFGFQTGVSGDKLYTVAASGFTIDRIKIAVAEFR